MCSTSANPRTSRNSFQVLQEREMSDTAKTMLTGVAINLRIDPHVLLANPGMVVDMFDLDALPDAQITAKHWAKNVLFYKLFQALSLKENNDVAIKYTWNKAQEYYDYIATLTGDSWMNNRHFEYLETMNGAAGPRASTAPL